MKRNKSYVTGTLSMALLLSVCLLSSCLKDKAPGDENYSHSPALIAFQYGGFSQIPFTASLLGTPQDSLALEVTLSVASLTLKSDVTATIAPDDASLAAYNADTTRSNFPTTFLQLPSAMYTLSNGGKVTVPAGKQMVDLVIHFAADQIDFTQDYALALKITSAQGAAIPTNLNTAIVILKLRNKYEGNYVNTGAITRFNGSNEGSGVLDQFPAAGSSFFSTVTLTEVDGGINVPGFSPVNFTMTVNTDNSVTIGPSISNFTVNAGNNSTKPSSYDPATQTFTIHGAYLNGAGALREFDVTLTFTP
jgi:Domain of unknown function (DUF1735)